MILSTLRLASSEGTSCCLTLPFQVSRETSMPSTMYLAQLSSLRSRVSSYVSMFMNTYCTGSVKHQL